jgi:solute carrier family 38 (sodium-coupled neutral amino acid transporter), member 11
MATDSIEYAILEDDEDSNIEEINLEIDTTKSIRSTVMDSAFNFTNSIVGAGIIGLPYAMKQAGLISGLLLLGFLAWLVDYTVILLIKNAKLSSRSTYQGLIEFCFGSKGLLLISIFQFVFAYGALCAYTVIIGDTIPRVFVSMLHKESILYPILTSRSFVIICCTVFVSLPLSLYRDISALAKTSAVSLAMICVIVLCIAFKSFTLPSSLLGDPALRLSIINQDIFQVFQFN